MHAFELFANYILPAILTFALDVRVLFTRPPEFLALSRTPSVDVLSKGISTSKKSKRNSCCPKLELFKRIRKENSKNSASVVSNFSIFDISNFLNSYSKQFNDMIFSLSHFNAFKSSLSLFVIL